MIIIISIINNYYSKTVTVLLHYISWIFWIGYTTENNENILIFSACLAAQLIEKENAPVVVIEQEAGR